VRPTTRLALDTLQRNTFEYFLKETNPTNGLVPDNTRRDAPSSIAAVGLALACYPVGAERGFITRTEAIRRTLTTLRFFRDSRQSDEKNGHRLQRVLLSFSRHANRAAYLELGGLDDRHHLPACRCLARGHLL